MLTICEGHGTLYLNEERGACEYTIEEYNLETLTKRKYKVILDEETEFDVQDYRSLSDFVDADKLRSHFEIKDGVLLEYIGHDKELIILKAMKRESLMMPH